jgi:hypothetical protein
MHDDKDRLLFQCAEELAEYQAELKDLFIKFCACAKTSNRDEILANLNKIVINEETCQFDDKELGSRFWITYDAQQKCGDWIPVSEYEPETSGDYLLTDGKWVDLCEYNATPDAHFSWHYYGDRLDLDDSAEPIFTHWMVAPKPPEANAND